MDRRYNNNDNNRGGYNRNGGGSRDYRDDRGGGRDYRDDRGRDNYGRRDFNRNDRDDGNYRGGGGGGGGGSGGGGGGGARQGAERLARIHGTEEDKVNCPFYYKIGACRHGDRCSRLHSMPAFSQTLLFKHLYQNKKVLASLSGNGSIDRELTDEERKQEEEDFFDFYEDLFLEVSKFGRIVHMAVCDNYCDHMVGHVYVHFQEEDDAADALEGMKGRFYDGRPIFVEYCPVTDFRESRCRQFDDNTCTRLGLCNFMHIKPVPKGFIQSLFECAQDSKREERQRRIRDGLPPLGADRNKRIVGDRNNYRTGDRGRRRSRSDSYSSRSSSSRSSSRSRSRSRERRDRSASPHRR